MQNHSFHFSVMRIKCSYLNEHELKSVVLPSCSQVPTLKSVISWPSSSTSRPEIYSTTFFSSSPPRSEAAPDPRSLAWVVKDDEARSGGTSPRIFLPRLKRGKLKRRVTIGSTLSASSGSDDVDEADWPPFADEDYIVFCFEEDGAFHVVMEESPKTASPKLQCEEHGNHTCACSDETKVDNQSKNSNRRDCLLPNKEGLSSSSDLVIDVADHLLATNKCVLEIESTESMECRNGSVESTDSSLLDDEEQSETESTCQVEHSSFSWELTGLDVKDHHHETLPAIRRDCFLPNTEVDKEDRTLSPQSQMTVMFRIDELLKGDEEVSSIESDQSSGFSESESRGDQVEANEEVGSESAKSSISRQSNSNSGSFEFPLLELEWIGSPVTWPRSGKVHYRRHKSKPACLRCCKF